ncbi:Dynein light chain 1 cytoplasmic [Taenia solium]|eukprot:TsM_000958200 transcript=TsM_000958200 gene=TsM_000958200
MNSVEDLLNEIGKPDENNIQLIVRAADMNDAQQTEAANIIAEALTIHYKETEAAKMVKTHFDSKYGRAWQCIVGKHFARCLTLP